MSEENKKVQSMLEEAAARTLTVEEEAIREVFARMPWGQKFTLASGQEVEIRRFVKPRESEDGGWEFGFDVACPSFHIEFMVYRTGWGRDVSALGIEVPDDWNKK